MVEVVMPSLVKYLLENLQLSKNCRSFSLETFLLYRILYGRNSEYTLQLVCTKCVYFQSHAVQTCIGDDKISCYIIIICE